MLHHKSVLIIISIIGLLVAAPSLSSFTPPTVISKVTAIRAPASIAKKSKSTETLKFDCTTRKLSTDAQQIRLSGKLCKDFDLNQVKEIQVKNQKSGENGTLFMVDRKTVTTEYFRLADGENKILFKQGGRSFEFVVEK